MTSRVLVTGGSGFIGTNLVHDLRQHGFEVLNLDRSRPLRPDQLPAFRQIDILDASHLLAAFEDFRPEQVVHLAARTDLEPGTTLRDFAANTTGVENLLDAIQATPSVTRLLVASSMLVCKPGYKPANWDDYAPSTVYGESKVLTETIIKAREPGVTWALVRPTTIWGPWSTRLEQGLFKFLISGRYLHPRGKACHRTYGYVGNTVHQIRRLLEAPATKIHRNVYYLGDPPIELLDFINRLSQQLAGKPVATIPYWAMKAGALFGDLFTIIGLSKFPLNTYRLMNMTTDNVLDTSSTLAITGENPFSIDSGLEQTADWLKSR